MGTGYVRNDTSGNIANGKVIDATDLDGEFDAIVTAFSTSGHTHDGTTAEGGKVTKLLGTSLTLGDGTAGTDITVTFDGETSDGVLVWMEDEDYFQFNDDILMNTNEKLQFRDTGIYISSNADGDLDIVSDGTAVDSINIESAGGITLDAGTAASGVIFEDDGTEMLRIYNSSSDVYIESKVSDKDILIRGNDGGSAVTAVTFDMSAAGLATFGGGITSTAVANTLGATSFNDANITNVGNIALDSITADGSTITITGNTTFADGAYNFNIASHDGSNGLQLGGTLVTATAAELNIIDGGTSASSTTVADADRVVFNDDGTMKQVAVTDLAAYFDDEITAMPNLVTTAATTVGALNSGSITSGFGTIDTGSSTITTTGLISGGSLDIDDVLINGTTIGHTDDTDLITLADGVVTVAGEISVTTLDIGGTNVTATAAELNILDGVTATASELNIMDGVTATAAELNIMDGVTSTASEINLLDGSAKSTSSITIADADAFIVIDGTTTKQIPASDIATYATGSTGILSTGTGNVAFGSNALDSIGSGANYMIAIGTDALTTHAAGGSGHIAIGHEAMEYYNHTNGNNVALGYQALKGQTTDFDGSSVTHQPSSTVAIGYRAAYNAMTADSTIAIGHDAYYYSRGDYSIAMGYQSQYGSSSTSQASNGDYNTSLGYKALHLITTGDDNIAIGRNAAYSNTTGAINIAIGLNALYDNTGSGRNVAIGEDSCYNIVGSNNVGIGYYALKGTGSTTTDASYNVAIGNSVLTAVTTGSYNIGMGSTALTALSTGSSNTAIGAGAGDAITTGSHNAALGGSSLGSLTEGTQNIGVGITAGHGITTGSYNIAIGYESSNATSTASKNTTVGHAASKRLTSGTNNVVIGNKAGMGVITGDHNVAIGGEAALGFGDISVLENESAYNAFTVGDRNVAIGSRAMGNSATASDATEKNTAVGYSALYTVQGGDNNTGIGYGAGDSITDGTNNTCIGYLADTAAADSDNSITLGNSSIASLRCADTSISSLSDERDKKDIVDSTYGLDLLKTFRPVSFTWNKRPETATKPSWMSDEEWKEEQDAISNAVDPYKDRPAIGFLAQELRDAVPESDRKRLDLVDEQNPDRLEAKQGKLIPILVKALQELSAKNDALEARIKTLEG